MLDRKPVAIWLIWTVAALLLFAGNAAAYVGPGAGMELVGYAMSLLAWIVVAFCSVLLWPIYSLWRRFRKPKELTDGSQPMVDSEPKESCPSAETKEQ
jgi:hypothetical protein